MFKEILFSVPLFMIVTSLNLYLLNSYFLTKKTGAKLTTMAVTMIISSWIYLEINSALIPLGPGTLRSMLLYTLLYSYLFINLVFYLGKWYQKFFVASIYTLILVFAESIVWMVANFFLTPEEALLLDHTDWHAGEMSNFLILLILLVMYKGKRKPIRKLPTNLLLIHTAIIITWLYISTTMLYETDIFSLVLILLLMGLFYAYSKLTEDAAVKNLTYQIQAQNQQMLLEHYQQVENYQQEIRMMRHEMKNQMLRLQGYLDEEDYPQISQQLKKWFDEIGKVKHLHFTPNKSVNSLLSYKYRQAEEKRITCEFQVELPPNLAIDEYDLTSLLGNILDNAIEACEYCPEQRHIFLRLSFRKNCLFLICENTIDGLHRSFETRKEDRDNHGFGRTCIQQIVDQYEGELNESWQEKSFIMELTLFEKEAKSIVEKTSLLEAK